MGVYSAVSTFIEEIKSEKGKEMKVSLPKLVLIYAGIGVESTASSSCPTDWTEDPGDSSKCLPDATSSDFSVTCGPSAMTVTFNYNHLYENIENFLDGNSFADTGTLPIGVYTNGTEECNIIRAGSYVDGKFKISIDYTSSCVALTHANDEISLSTLIMGHSNLATVTDYVNGVEVHVGQVLSFNVDCKWSDTESVEIGALSVTTEDFSNSAGTADEGDAGYTSFEPSFSMAAYSDSKRNDQMDLNSDSAEIGESVHLTIVSDQTIESGGMFEWYVADCTVYAEENSGGSSYPIIKDDSQCGSSFLDVATTTGEWMADSTSSLVSFQFIAFQFAQAASDSIYLQCNIKMCLSTESCQPSCSSCSTGYQCLSAPAPTTAPPTYTWTDNADHSCGRATSIGEVKLEVWHSMDDCKLACHTMSGCQAIQIKKTELLKCVMFDHCELTADAEYDQASSPTWFSNVVTWEAKDKFRCDDTGNDVALTPGSVKSEAECRLACITEYSCTATALNRGTGVCNLYASCSPVADSMFVQASSTTRTPVSWTEPKEGWCDDSYPDTTMLRPQFEKFWSMDQCKLACQDNSDCTTISWEDETELCSLFSTCSPSSSGQATYTETAVVGPYDKCALWNGGATWCNSNCVSDMWGAVCRLSVGLNGGGCMTIDSCGGK